MGMSSQTRLATSTNGTTWTAVETPNGTASSATWQDIIFANGKFLMVGQNRMSFSTDGNTWTAVTGDITQHSWTSVVYADNKFVAVDGSGQKKVATSPDGITWAIVDVDPASSGSYSSITFGNGAFVGVANAGMEAESLVLFSNSDRGPAPTITSVSPASLTAGTTSNITITGTGFRTGLSVTFGGIACSSPTRESSTRVSCMLPSGVSGVVDVVVTNSDGQSATLTGGFTATERGARTNAPTTTTTSTTAATTSTNSSAGTGTSGSASQGAGIAYENAVPGVTKTDTKVYTTPPTQVAASSAINVLTASQNRTLDVETRTPDVCVPNDDELVFLDEGRCVSAVVNATTRKVVRVLRTTVVDDAVSELRAGNAVVVLAPIYFDFVSAQLDARAIARLRAIAPRASAAGSILVVGHSGTLNGNSPENVKLSQDRARNTVNALRRVGAKGPFFAVGLGALDPARADKTESAQAKNRRVVIVLVP
jgi:outer membrane protein OmpA-like peptidoglycan-associated protein